MKKIVVLLIVFYSIIFGNKKVFDNPLEYYPVDISFINFKSFSVQVNGFYPLYRRYITFFFCNLDEQYASYKWKHVDISGVDTAVSYYYPVRVYINRFTAEKKRYLFYESFSFLDFDFMIPDESMIFDDDIESKLTYETLLVYVNPYKSNAIIPKKNKYIESANDLLDAEIIKNDTLVEMINGYKKRYRVFYRLKEKNMNYFK